MAHEVLHQSWCKPQVLSNSMAMLNRNLPLFSIGYISCSMVGNLLSHNRIFSSFQQFFGKGNRNILSSVKDLVKCASLHTRKTHIRISQPTMVPQACGLVLLKVIQLILTICTTPKQKNSLTKDVTFLYKSHGKWSSYERSDDEEVKTILAIKKILIIKIQLAILKVKVKHRSTFLRIKLTTN